MFLVNRQLMALQVFPKPKSLVALLASIAEIMLSVIVDPLETCRAENATTGSARTCLVCVGIILS